jgi:hypothetical protein
MKHEEAAPPYESWPEYLKGLEDKDLTDLAGDYCWIMEKNRPEDQRDAFRKKREMILAECERRGLDEAARACRPSMGSGGA